MTSSADSSPQFASSGLRRPAPRLSWLAVVGFGMLGLLWPLLRLLHVDTVLGSLTTVIIGFTVTSVVWIACAGLGNVPRPVLTLALAGVLSGVLFAGAGMALGEWPDVGPVLMVAAIISEVALAGMFGVLAGLAAWWIQLSRASR